LDRFENFNGETLDGQKSDRAEEERVERSGWPANNWHRWNGWKDWSVLHLSDRSSHSSGSRILSQCSDFRTVWMWW